jgi:D-alanine-D-alanine ligase
MSPSRQLRVHLLHGASDIRDRPDEADTLAQVEEIGAAAGRLGFDVEAMALGGDLAVLRTLSARGVDLVFNLVETLSGEGRLAHQVPRTLEQLGIPYTGCSARALAATSDKTKAKRLMWAFGVPTPEWSSDGTGLTPDARVIVKPVWEDASVGIDADSVVDAALAAPTLAARKARFGGEWFAERFIDGREFSLSLLDRRGGPEILPVAETMFEGFPVGRPRIVDYEAKWRVDDFAYTHTPRRFDTTAADAPLTARLRALALQCWSIFELEGYARVDFRVDPEGRPFVLEVNGNPCLSSDAGFVAAAAEHGLGFDDVIARIVAAALSKARLLTSHL